MSWTINVTDNAKEFLDGLTADERVEVFASIRLLGQLGPALRRPTSGTLRDSELSKLKELGSHLSENSSASSMRSILNRMQFCSSAETRFHSARSGGIPNT